MGSPDLELSPKCHLRCSSLCCRKHPMCFCFAFNTSEAQNKFQVLANCLSPAIWFPPTASCGNCCREGRGRLPRCQVQGLLSAGISSAGVAVWDAGIPPAFCYLPFLGPGPLFLILTMTSSSAPPPGNLTHTHHFKDHLFTSISPKAPLVETFLPGPTQEPYLPVSIVKPFLHLN